MNVATGGGSSYIQQSGGSFTLTNADNTIQGAGIIGNGGLTFVNQSAGTVNANSSGQTLLFNGGNITNAGLLEASGGGTLQLAGMTINNSGGNISAGSNSFVQLTSNAYVEGGTLNINSGGWLGTASGNTAYLDGTTQGALTINGNFTSDLNTNTFLYGTINNNGNLQLNAGNATNSVLLIGSNLTLQGGGTLSMNVASGGGNAYIEQTGGSYTLTNVNNTIQGSGIIGNGGLSLLNEAGGTINANSSGQTLLLNGGPITNAGLLEASSGGTLQIAGVTVNNSGGQHHRQ